MWNEKFSGTDYLYGTEPNEFLRECAELIRDKQKILCLAEGEGRNAVHLAQQGHEVTAVDASEVGLAKAEKLAQSRGVQIKTQVVDLAEFEFAENEWDAVVSIFCHLPPALRKRVHQGVVKSVRPGGYFILEGYHPKQLNHSTGGPKNIELLMTLDELKQELTGFCWQHEAQVCRNIKEGHGHTGDGWVTQLFGTLD